MIFITLLTLSTLENTISNQQEAQIDQLSELITFEINRTFDVNTLVESYQTTILEALSLEILETFNDRDFSSITIEELNSVLEKHEISGIALFKDSGDDVIIEKSTSEVEIGLSTKTWGFWYTAFRQLFDHGHVSLEKGTSNDSFWVGPRSMAYEQKGFYIFAYRKVPNQPYLLNLFIDDKKAFNAVNTIDTNDVFDKLIDNADFIDEIAIINVEAWNNRFQYENRSKLQDFTIEYGRYKSFSAEDTYFLNKACDLELQESITKDLVIESQKKTKRYIKLTDHEVLVFVLNRESQNRLRFNIAITVISGLFSVWLLGYLLMRYHNKKFTTLLNIEKERLEVAESYKQTVQILPSIVLRLSISGNKFIVKHCEGKALKLIGVDADSSRGKSLDNFMPSEYIKRIDAELRNMNSGESSRFEYKIGKHIFENKIEWIKASTDASPLTGEAIILWNDITELRHSEDRARFMAYHDHLTTLPNRHYFKDEVTKALESLTQPLYLAFIDLDGFKNVNDTAGHDIGDELLSEVANRLTLALDKKHFAARMGGDEFAVLFKNIEDENILEESIKQIKSEIVKPYKINNQFFNIGMSIGISKAPRDGRDYITLLKKADIAMYKVKYSGKGNHQYYKPEKD